MRLNRMLFAAAIAIRATPLPGQAADVPKAIELDNLRTPTSPAFTLLDVNPSVVARPSTPRALATEFVSSSRAGTVIPNNYAAEFAPYWLTPKPMLTYQQYRNPSIAQSFSISLATGRPDSAADTATLVAVGARALALSGRPSSRFLKLEDSLTVLQRARTGLFADYLDAVDAVAATTEELKRLRADSVAAQAANDAARVRQLAGQILAARAQLVRASVDTATRGSAMKSQADLMRSVAKAMGSADAERVGHFFEIALAAASAYQGTFESGRLTRAGMWGTYTYRMESPRVDVITLLRYVRNLRDEGQNALDLGGRIHLARGAIGLSSEWVSRTAFKVASSQQPSVKTLTLTSSSRAVGIVDYRAADELFVTISFGQNYKALGEDRHPLVARLGMQFSYGDKPVVQRP